MKVMLFDESHEKDLEESVNDFLDSDNIEIIDIKYQVAMMIDPRSQEQIYSFSCMVIYNELQHDVKYKKRS